MRRLHPEQERAIESVLAGRDTLVVLPTGYGKSLVYQVPALLRERPTVVVSPLIALMADQEQSLRRRDVPVVRLDSTVRAAARRAALRRLEEGGRLIVLTTPETLESDSTRPSFERGRPWLLCVDEAHCISEWGHDFRPAYLRLGAQREALGSPAMLALTATARLRVREDIAARLGMRVPVEIVAPPHRPNLRFEVELAEGDRKPEVGGPLIRRLARPGIVYCSTTLATDRVWAALDRARIPCERYHGRLAKADRERAQERFMRRGGRRVMVATSAFGMGIDKPDIRSILHWQAPGSLEQYVQEAGRAGRDGRPARCILLYDPADLAIQRHLQRQGRTSPDQLARIARALAAWTAEGRGATSKELALAAGVAQTTCRATCAQLEQLGILTQGADRAWRPSTGREELGARVLDLARRLEVQRKEDEARLQALDDYARTQECRSRFIRRWFGEQDPPACGTCDRCRPIEPRKRGGRRERRRAPAAARPRGERAPQRPAGKGRGGRRRRRPRKA